MNNPLAVDILLVEDNPQDAELAIRALKKHNLANNLYHVEDGAEALDFLFCRGAYAHREPCARPKIVLLDLKLPKVGGLEVLKAIKDDPGTKTIPVVIVTSSSQDPDIETAYSLGANSYVVKPVNFDDFFNAMNNLGFYWLMLNQPSQ
jgi:two-component system, response regulator